MQIKQQQHELTFCARNAEDRGERVDVVFNDLKVKTAEAWNAKLKGMAKHNAFNAAFELYANMTEQKVHLDVGSVNGLLKCLTLTTMNHDEKVEKMRTFLTNMRQVHGVKPNLATFNACMQLAASFGISYANSQELVLNILAEMKALNISIHQITIHSFSCLFYFVRKKICNFCLVTRVEPCLATWAHAITAVYARSRTTNSDFMTAVVDELERESAVEGGLEWLDVQDAVFFRSIMFKCATSLSCAGLARRINALLMSNNNIKFLNGNLEFIKYL